MCEALVAVLMPKTLGPLLSALGSLLLAWRVKIILDEVTLAARGADANFRGIGNALQNAGADLPLLVGFDERVERSLRRGKWLLVSGFLLLAAGAALTAYGNWLGSTGYVTM